MDASDTVTIPAIFVIGTLLSIIGFLITIYMMRIYKSLDGINETLKRLFQDLHDQDTRITTLEVLVKNGDRREDV